MAPRPRVIYDANVLFAFHISHLLVFTAQAGLVRAHWTREIEREWVERALEKKPDLRRESLELRRDLMNRAIPTALVSGYENLIEAIDFPGTDDRHVVAAAIHVNAVGIVTHDQRHFNEKSLGHLGLRAIEPDQLMVECHDADPEATVAVVEQARQALRKSMPDWEAYLDILGKAGFPELVSRLRGYGNHHKPPDPALA